MIPRERYNILHLASCSCLKDYQDFHEKIVSEKVSAKLPFFCSHITFNPRPM